MEDQRLLPLTHTFSAIPSAKMKAADRMGLYSWDRFYSAFSERFASAALRQVGGPAELLVDPFLGSATSLIAAAKLGLRTLAFELDPYGALLARAKIASKARGQRVMELLRPAASLHKSEDPLFSATDLSYATTVYERISRQTGSDSWRSLLTDRQLDSEVIALAAVLCASSDVANLVGGSNPVWSRVADAAERKSGRSLEEITLQKATMMLRDLADAWANSELPAAEILNTDFLAADVPQRGERCVVLTSPPYPNRLDYVVNHLGPLTLLSRLRQLDLPSLRASMIGTTSVSRKAPPQPSWGQLARDFLEQVANHPSKASGTYYYWFYANYFSDTFRALRQLQRLCAAGFSGLWVVQNSFYKELTLPLPEIVAEMARELGIEASLVSEQVVRSYLATLNPARKTRGRQKILREVSVLLTWNGSASPARS